MSITLRTRMRLIPDKREVRALEERWEGRAEDNARRQYGRGHAPAVFRWRETQEGLDGGSHKVWLTFDTRKEMTDPLRNAVRSAGWTWRGVLKL
ncbi:hypothetical protein [Streptomyces sp. NPDC059009]|uniref:hypothetical protein n=1 Tax=Streptomyces sp. NPDC059009 TaxID=3346694 RepID=UPI0036C49647